MECDSLFFPVPLLLFFLPPSLNSNPLHLPQRLSLGFLAWPLHLLSRCLILVATVQIDCMIFNCSMSFCTMFMVIMFFLSKGFDVAISMKLWHLQAFTQTFRESKPGSLVKLACVSAIEDMLTLVSLTSYHFRNFFEMKFLTFG